MITQVELERYLLTDIDNSFTGQVQTWIDQMTKYIETYTDRQFSVDDEPTIRKYNGDGSRTLLVDRYSELDTVTVDGNTVTVLEYPANTIPKWKLETTSRFNRGRQNVEVSAKFGEEAPEDIRFACLVFTAGIIQKQTSKDKASEKIGDYAVTYINEAQMADHNRAVEILERYRKLL